MKMWDSHELNWILYFVMRCSNPLIPYSSVMTFSSDTKIRDILVD